MPHGKSKTPEYRTWAAMRHRCSNLKDRNYGGRGITVCERWLHSFAAFYADMGPRPSAGHSIDRVNNDGNYEPSNCRWATRLQQASNRRRHGRISDDWKAIMTPYERKILDAEELRCRRP